MRFLISPEHPSQKVEIQCSEWLWCELRIQAEDVLGDDDDEARDALTQTLSLTGGKTSVFELELALNDVGRQRLEWAGYPGYTITANARWW